MCQNHSTNIRVNAIAPGFFLTDQNRFLLTDEAGDLTDRGKTIIDHTPMGRFGESDELAGTLIWLISDASKFVSGIVTAASPHSAESENISDCGFLISDSPVAWASRPYFSVFFFSFFLCHPRPRGDPVHRKRTRKTVALAIADQFQNEAKNFHFRLGVLGFG